MPTYNPPPNWPTPPPGWTPPAGWKAPANWPPPPNGWQFWLPDKKDGSWFGRHKLLTSVGGGLAALLLIGSVASGANDQAPNATAPPPPDASPTATSSPTGQPTSAPPTPTPKLARVPAVEGLSLTEAKQKLGAAGLEVGDIDRQPSSKTKDTVLKQGVDKGTKLEPGSSVALVVAAPLPQVPSVVGLSLTEAKQKLSAAGLEVGDIDRQPSSKTKDTVLKQGVDKGTKLEPGSSVALVVAAPLPQVPSVVGKSEASAIKELKDAGFTVKKTTQTRTSGRDGVVLSQSPAGETPAKPNSVVRIVISNVQPSSDTGGTSNCTPGYSPCLPPASDYDCAGGSGNGPKYVDGPIRSRVPTPTA